MDTAPTSTENSAVNALHKVNTEPGKIENTAFETASAGAEVRRARPARASTAASVAREATSLGAP